MTRKFWCVLSLFYLTLIYSTSLHIGYGREATISTHYFTTPKGISSKEVNQQYPDQGAYPISDLKIDGTDFWKLGGFSGDSMFYMLQAKGDPSISPYKYRVIFPNLVRGLAFMSKQNEAIIWVSLNVLFVLATALVFTRYLQHYFHFDVLLSVVGGMLFITMLSVTRTTGFVMLEASSFLFCLLTFVALSKKQPSLFIVAASLGVLSKEVLVISSLLWLIETFDVKDRKTWIKSLFVASTPLIAFISVRLLLGGAALEVNYDFDLLKGELPGYLDRNGKRFTILVFLSFGFLWLGLLRLKENDFLKRQSIFIPLVILATFLLSGRVSRVIGVTFPVVIPLFLIYLNGLLPKKEINKS